MVVGAEEDVRRLDVAVDQPGGVGRVERGGDLVEHGEHAWRVDGLAAEQPPQVGAVDQGHVQVELPVDLAERVHRHHVRVPQPGGDPRLPSEPGHELGVHPGAGEPFQGHHAPVDGVVRPVHGAHAALADQLSDAVRAEVRRAGQIGDRRAGEHVAAPHRPRRLLGIWGLPSGISATRRSLARAWRVEPAGCGKRRTPVFVRTDPR